MFNVSEQTALLADFNPRQELHGEDRKPAADLKFVANVPAEMLSVFDSSLRALLYWRSDAVKDLADSGADAPNLRFPLLGPLSWGSELVGANVTIHYGIGESNIVLPDAVVGKFRIEPQEGGTCILTWRVQCHPTQEQAGKLAFMIGESFPVTVEPPTDDPT